MGRHCHIFALACVLFLITFLLYVPALRFDVLNWDDDAHITQNPFVVSFGEHYGLKDIFTTTVNKTYVPLSILTFALEHVTFGQDPFHFHLHNVFLHAFVTLLVFVFTLHLGCSERAAFMAALIFAIHPTRVEAVAWISARKDVLYGIFYMGALVFYARYLRALGYARPLALTAAMGPVSRRGSAGVLFAAVFCCSSLSALAKPMALSLPLLLCLLDWFYCRDIGPNVIREKVFICLMMLPVIAVTFFLHSEIVSRWVFPQSLLLWIWCCVYYIFRFLAPLPAPHFAPVPHPVSLAHPSYVLTLVAFCALLAGVLTWRRSRTLLFVLLWYGLSAFFLFRTSVAGHLHIVADRFIYLPSLGFCLGLGLIYDRALTRFQQRGRQQLIQGAACLIVICLCLVSFSQMRMWQDSVTFWQAQYQRGFARQDPVRKAIICTKYAEARLSAVLGPYGGTELEEEGCVPTVPKADLQPVQALLREALEHNPRYALAYLYLGKLAIYGQDEYEAIAWLQEAIKRDPNNFEAYLWLGRVYLSLGESDVALQVLDRAKEGHPDKAWISRRIQGILSNAGGAFF